MQEASSLDDLFVSKSRIVSFISPIWKLGGDLLMNKSDFVNGPLKVRVK